MNLPEFLSKFQSPIKTGKDSWAAKCPSHEDKRPSLVISQGTKGIVIKCHRGCTTEEVVTALGLKVADLFPERPARPCNVGVKAQTKPAAPPAATAKGDKPAVKPEAKPAAKRRFTAFYDYKDEEGNLLFQVVRCVPKDFLQRRQDKEAKGGWNWKVNGTRKVIYRLPEVLAALKKDAFTPLWIVEGEKDVHSLEKSGALATCNPGGAGKWLPEYAKSLEAARMVFVVGDNDPVDAKGKFVGMDHAKAVARSLLNPIRTVKIIQTPKGKDVTEFFELGGTATELLLLADQTKELQPPAVPVAPAAAPAAAPAGDGQAKAPASPVPAAEVELPPCVFDTGRQRYFVPSKDKREWLPIGDTRVQTYLKLNGFTDWGGAPGAFGVTSLEQAMNRIVMERNVHFAGQIAGWFPGTAEIAGQRVLVTRGPKIIEPKQGEFPTLEKLFREMFTDTSLPDPTCQWDLFMGWLQSAYVALVDRTFRPGLALTLCGKGSSGKSVVSTLVTKMLGGRTANPYLFMTGRTEFNSDLIGAELLVIDDNASERDIKSRQAMGQNIKLLTVSPTMQLHGKGRDGLTVERYSRLMICLNDDPHDLMVLPPMDDSIKTKFLLLRVAAGTFPQITVEAPNVWNEFRARMDSELPAFLWWLTRVFKVRPELASARFGVEHWLHPVLFHDIEDMHPCSRLMELIDHVRPWEQEPFGGEFWEGTVGDLEDLLRAKAPSRSAGVLNTNLATTLRSARSRMEERISNRKSGHTIWIIKRPAKAVEEKKEGV